jgi:hypothetical protein
MQMNCKNKLTIGEDNINFKTQALIFKIVTIIIKN